MIYKENEVQELQNRVIQLERQLAKAQAKISALTSPRRDKPQRSDSPQDEQQGQAEKANFLVNEECLRRTLMIAPYPLMIRRDDDRVVMVNTAWTEITGYTLEDIPTIAEWTRKAYGEYAPERQSFVRNEGFSQESIKKWGEFEVTTRSGTKRIWDFSTAPLGFDENDRELVMMMAVDITDRKSAEEGLRAVCDAAIWLARLPGENPNPVARVSNTGIVLYHNLPAAKLPGWTCAVNEPLPVQLFSIVQQAVIQSRVVEQDVSLGERLYAVSVVPIPGEAYLNIYGRDITDREQFEIALRKRESILTQAGEMAHLGAWDIEFRNQEDVNANPLSWSDEVYRIFGYVPGEVQPSNELFFERVHPDDRVLVQESVAQAIARQQPYVIEHRILRLDGEERIVQEHAEVFFDEAGKPLRIVGAVQDITERKHAEEALRESEERFRSLADSMPQLVWSALPDGTVDYYNSRSGEYWGIKQVMPTVWEWAPVLHPEDRQATVSAWFDSLETGEIYQVEHRVRMAGGSYRWHLSRAVPMRDEKGRIIRWFGTATDIHDLKLAEEQSTVYAERLEHSNQELEHFAFMASHDLQEPLRKIEMFGDLLLDEAEGLNEQGRNYLNRMRNAAERMHAMVEGLLKLARVTTQGQPFVRVNLSQVCSDVLADLGDQIRRTNARLEFSSLPVLEGDPLQLRQLMQNLIGNALKYHRSETPPDVKVSAKQLSGKVQIFVEDKGIGFEQKNAARIFQPFERLVGRSQYEGSGMGLAICRRIVERHGGEITAQSQPGVGTTFIVTLPISHSESPRTD